MTKKTLFIVFAILFFSIIWRSSWNILDSSRKVKGAITTLSSSEIISLTNLERTKSLLSPLHPNKSLSRAALLKAEDMFSKNYFNHLDNEGNGSWNLIEDEGYIYAHAGENLAKNFSSADSLVGAWMESDAHRDNLMSKNYTDIGVAVLEEEDQIYIVQILASPLPSSSVNSPNSRINFSFSSPLTGDRSKDYNVRFLFMSFFIALLFFIISYIFLSTVISKYSKIKMPNIKYWQRK